VNELEMYTSSISKRKMHGNAKDCMDHFISIQGIFIIFQEFNVLHDMF